MQYRESNDDSDNDSDELKFFDMGVESENIQARWGVIQCSADPVDTGCLHPITEDAGGSGRDGNSYWIHSVEVHGTVRSPPWSASESYASWAKAPSDIRLQLLLDKDCQAGFSRFDHMEQGTAGCSAVFDYVNQHQDLTYKRRFEILDDQRIILSPQVSTWALKGTYTTTYYHFSPGAVEKWESYYEFDPPLRVTCSGTTGDRTEILDNCLAIVGVSYDTDVEVSFISRVRFSD